jgi:dihydrofolate reductase
MNLIVAVDSNWGIGWHDRLLFRIAEDMKHFRALTVGKTVILGRKTLQTLPGGRPLEKRTNIVMTRSGHFDAPPALICRSLGELRDLLHDRPEADVYVIGGASIYQQLLPFCRLAHVTKIDRHVSADCFFPNLDQQPGWELVAMEAHQTDNGFVLGEEAPVSMDYSFCVYRQLASRFLHDEP